MAAIFGNKITVRTFEGTEVTTHRKLFLDRMTREGRIKEFNNAVKALLAERGAESDWNRCSYEIMKRWGYTPESELALHNKRIDDHFKERYLDQRGEEKISMAEDQEDFDWDQTFAELPDEVKDLPADLAWIYGHPAMSPNRKPKRKDADIELTPKDSKGAPSRGAINMLAHYVNRKPEFFKLILAHFSKKNASGKGVDSSANDEIPQDEQQIEEMLREFRVGKQ